MSKKEGNKRYNLVISQALFEEIEAVAEKRQTTVVEVMRGFFKIGLLVEKGEIVMTTPDGKEIIIL